MTDTAAPPRTKRIQQKVETRARIVDSAIDVFTAGSVVTTPLDEVARAAGVSKATLFFHFGSRLELIEALGFELYVAGAHSTFRPAEAGLAPALRVYLAAQHNPRARLLWEIGDVLSAAGRPGPDFAYRYLISEIRARLADDRVVAGARDVLARVLAPAALVVARRAAFGQADAREQERFVGDAVELVASAGSDGST